MSYTKTGYPVEAASKIGHMRLVTHPLIQKIIENFESHTIFGGSPLPVKTGTIDLSLPSGIRNVITVDGGQSVVPNPIRREKAIAFLQVCACILKMDDLRRMRNNPMMDPRDIAQMLRDNIWYNPAVLPLSGVHVPGQSVRKTIRDTVDAVIVETGLYETLRFLVSREWDAGYSMPSDDSPRFECWECEALILLPKSKLSFPCPGCGAPHRLSDYLGIGAKTPEDWSREEAATAMRDVLETLTLFHFIRVYMNRPEILNTVLFIKDGPLLLRAGLSRLIEPIRALISELKNRGILLHLVGIEKNGDLCSHADEFSAIVSAPGDHFVPTVKYLVEEVSGQVMSTGYRNRVSYGAKALVRIGAHHVLVLNVPTGEFLTEPKPQDLIAFEPVVRTLSELVSYQYKNALVPLILANSAASIAQKPSGGILLEFANQLLKA